MQLMKLHLLTGWPPSLTTWPTRDQWLSTWPTGWPTGWPVNPTPVDIPPPDLISEEEY